MIGSPHTDIAIVGGGLAGGLIALALAARRPDLRTLLIEERERFGGDHLWSFFEGDVAPEDRWLVAPLICQAWSEHEVRFADHSRILPGAYHSIVSERLDAVLRERLPADALMTSAPVEIVTPTSVRLSDGRTIAAGGVIDARGSADFSALDLGYQSFLGQELDLAAPHGLAHPIIMDATVAQADGYRFVYVLPLGPKTVFVEDTYYAEHISEGGLDRPLLEKRIADYAAAKGWRIQQTGRAETGILPVCMGGDFEAFWQAGGAGVAKAGLRGGFFHAMTGYSLPDAVRQAIAVAGMADLAGPALHGALRKRAQDHWHGQRFYRMLATLLLRAADPPERHRVLSRFYRLDPALIARFYAGQSTVADKIRIMVGKPPVALGRAIAALGA
jgi:lycopene beta-cyclase